LPGDASRSGGRKLDRGMEEKLLRAKYSASGPRVVWRGLRSETSDYERDRRNSPCGLYSGPRKSAGMEGHLMGRLMLFTTLLLQCTLFQCTAVFCQSPATPLGSGQTSGKVSLGQLAGQCPFDFSGGLLGQSAARPSSKSLECNGLNSTLNQAGAPIDFDRLFSRRSANLKTDLEFFARNESSFSSSPLAVQRQFKGEPIPTQWPTAKVEQIPTLWPNLKLQPIEGGSRGLVPARNSRK
jgi:hypothetical protein